MPRYLPAPVPLYFEMPTDGCYTIQSYSIDEAGEIAPRDYFNFQTGGWSSPYDPKVHLKRTFRQSLDGSHADYGLQLAALPEAPMADRSTVAHFYTYDEAAGDRKKWVGSLERAYLARVAAGG